METGMRGSAPRGMRGWRLAGLAAIAWLCLALAACSTGDNGATPTATTGSGATVAAGTTTASPTTQSGPTSTPFGNGTPGAQLGTTDVCSEPANSPSNLPSTIPAYPGAQIRVGSLNGNSGVFGLCIADTVQNVDTFYAAQLPTHGWQKVTDEALGTSRQLTASQGSTNLVLTISPDAAIPGDSQAIIIYSGS
jgi:hypothetical protein